MKNYEIVQRLQASPGKLDKEQIILEAFMSGNREFFIGARLAYDARVRFYVQKVPAIADEDLNPQDPGTFTFADFIVLTDKLRKRELTGNAAKNAIAEAAGVCHGPSWNDFYRRVLRKDFQCGCTESTINKALNRMTDVEAQSLVIPVFSCQLAKNGEDHPKKVCGKKLIDIKLDGVRFLTEVNKETRTVSHYSRDGLPFENFPDITRMCENFIDIFPESMMLDGEIVGETFQELMTSLNRKKNVDTSSAKLALFDMIPLRDFNVGFCPTPQDQRHLILAELEVSGMLREFTQGRIFVIPKKEIDLDTEEGKAEFNEFNKLALLLKYEGIMIKTPDAPYKCNRNDGWLKKKPKITVSLEICGFKKGKPDSKYSEVLGSIFGRGFDEGKQIETYVGGFTDKQRKDFWLNRDKMMGYIMEVEADALTKEQDSDDIWSLRFPVFKALRGTKPGEKL
jgi:DNA ligase-1